uniref:Uncharacterized protein n=1 Tax=Lutzomyia longipalpis TaxID=7200 RepID=A0A1B0CLF9_LUTLO
MPNPTFLLQACHLGLCLCQSLTHLIYIHGVLLRQSRHFLLPLTLLHLGHAQFLTHCKLQLFHLLPQLDLRISRVFSLLLRMHRLGCLKLCTELLDFPAVLLTQCLNRMLVFSMDSTSICSHLPETCLKLLHNTA